MATIRLASAEGKRFHRAFMGVEEDPVVVFNQVERGEIDDAIVFALCQRARSQGIDAYVLPQAPALPLANRREDVLFLRP